jgi:cytochrome c oxidase subunit 2
MMSILVFVVTLLVIVSLVQVLRVSELLSEINNTDVNEVTDSDNDTQGKLLLFGMILFIGFVIWQMIEWDHYILPPASSEHGLLIDGLMSFTMSMILIVFFFLTPLLFYFCFRYRGNKNKKAYYYVHNNKLEIVWTVIPTIVLTGVIIYGLQVWNQAMNPDITNSKVIEIYSKQFGWTARYSGEDNKLGNANYKLVKGRNQLGVDLSDQNSNDDVVVTEVHLIKDEPVLLKFRSQDVIHSAFLPHFRVQMNCVPGMVTQFAFTPTKTTEEMRQSEGEDFDYVLLCNKICGAAHYNMQMKFIVETREEYDSWVAQQNTLKNMLTAK